MHPFVKQIAHRKESDLGVIAAAVEVGGAQRAHERGALPSQGRQLVEQRVRGFLPARLREFPFKIDMALQDPRPLNPLKMGDRQIYVYDAATRTVSMEPLTEILKYLPGKVAQCRIFAMSHEHDAELAGALRRALEEEPSAIVTNV